MPFGVNITAFNGFPNLSQAGVDPASIAVSVVDGSFQLVSDGLLTVRYDAEELSKIKLGLVIDITDPTPPPVVNPNDQFTFHRLTLTQIKDKANERKLTEVFAPELKGDASVRTSSLAARRSLTPTSTPWISCLGNGHQIETWRRG